MTEQKHSLLRGNAQVIYHLRKGMGRAIHTGRGSSGSAGSLNTGSQSYIVLEAPGSNTYGHSQLKTGHPVRSAIHKQLNGRLVLRWVTTWESLLL
ncbi:hypothetical protein KCU64_g7018, partial [Aureobasidium melanogenum]